MRSRVSARWNYDGLGAGLLNCGNVLGKRARVVFGFIAGGLGDGDARGHGISVKAGWRAGEQRRIGLVWLLRSTINAMSTARLRRTHHYFFHCSYIVSNCRIMSLGEGGRVTNEEQIFLKARINEAFTPSAPINNSDLFAGRRTQIDRVIQAIFQRGQHAIIFGERGVGKTSLANIIFDLMVLAGKSEFQVAKHTCGADVTFASMWRAIFRQISVIRNTSDQLTLDGMLPDDVGSEDIRETFQSADSPSIIIIDEVDRIAATETAVLLADTIKSLSDNSANTTCWLA